MPSSPQAPETARPGAGAFTSVPLAPSNRLLRFERRIKLWLIVAAAVILTLTALLLYLLRLELGHMAIVLTLVALMYGLLARVFFDQLLRPLQILANVIAAIREEDYSFRARGGRRGDTVGDLTLEINALSSTLQSQRAAAQDARALLERVLTSMHSPVLAFDGHARLRLLNTAAQQAFGLTEPRPIGHTAAELHLDQLLTLPDQGIYPALDREHGEGSNSAGLLTSHPIRWSVRRTTFRLNGLPHTLLVFSDVAAVLREEERMAWQRLIRVLSHEINNSLSPIKSIAGSLRIRTGALAPDDREDFERGLFVIEDRAASLNRFLQAYQRLTHLPRPDLQPVSVQHLIDRITQAETRLPVTILAGPAVMVCCDADQIQQALINLLQNAADAALAPEAYTPNHVPAVTVTWTATLGEINILIEDNGLGIDNPANLFVPFYTTKAQGSGIGLALSQQIAAAHRGRVALLAMKDRRGCQASLTLPLRELEDKTETSEWTTRTTGGPS